MSFREVQVHDIRECDVARHPGQLSRDIPDESLGSSMALVVLGRVEREVPE